MVQQTLAERLITDPEKVSSLIVDFLQRKVEEHNKDGIVLGLSGGIDSAVLATLATKAVGHSKVYAFYLFDRESQKKFREYARRVADKLNLNLEVREISPVIKARGAYGPWLMRIILFSQALNKLIVYFSRLFYYLFSRESHYALSLKRGELIKRKTSQTIYDSVIDTIEGGFNTRHIYRREILEAYALERNLLLVGAANKSESLVGWFVKDGVDDLPLEPLLGLYKTQVRQLARFLDVPPEIIAEAPSPDMFRGVTDEMVLGFPYEKIDKVLYVIEHGLDEKLVLDEGITPDEFAAIKNLNHLSAWKRENKHEFPAF